MTEVQFEQLRNNDHNEKFVEFGPKIQLFPLKLHNCEDDDLMWLYFNDRRGKAHHAPQRADLPQKYSEDYLVYQKDKNVPPESREAALKIIYVNQKMVRRYKALMEARYMAIEDLKVDENIDFLIRHLEAVEESCAERVLR